MELFLNSFKESIKGKENELEKEEISSLIYHDIFDYPLTVSEIIKWRSGFDLGSKQLKTSFKNGFYFLEGREGLIYRRLLKERISAKKLKIAKEASKTLSFLPFIKMVGITGALAMENAGSESDIDLVIVAKKGGLWTTRLLSYFLLKISNFSLRKPNDKDQKDKLCLNVWIDESELAWKKKRNIYTAHEIAQVIPLLNRDKTYDKFIWENRWIKKYWPNAVRIKKISTKVSNPNFILRFVEFIAFKLQYLKMKSKITTEVVTPTKALFHPNDWGKIILPRLSS